MMTPEELAEVDRLRRWKAEATEVLLGLQDLGRALNLPLGERITGPAALAEVDRLRAQVAGAWDEGYQQACDDIDWDQPRNTRQITKNPYHD